tara:strand:- start:4513 stop:5019 length:507 start_codon:yes stop_codon:yes gene_type:complete
LKALKDYTIQFVSLKLGTHYFEFNVDNKFFEEFDYFEFVAAKFKVELAFEKKSTMMLLNFNFSGEITVPCDRCLEDLNIDIEGEEKLIVKFGNEPYNGTDDILILPEHEHEINVAQYIYEFIEINIPQKRAHDEDDCNVEALNKLNEYKTKNNDNIDPRWSGLDKFNN